MFGTRSLDHAVARRGLGGTLRRRTIGLLAAVALGAASLTGCAAGMIAQTVDQVPNHDGPHGTVGPIAVSNAILGDATNPAAAVAFPAGASIPLTFWATNNSENPDTLTSITTSAGTVTLTGDATVPGKGALEVGSATVTAVITAESDVKYGYPVTVAFNFANAGTVTLQVPAAIPAGREGDRAGTDIYPAEETNLWNEGE